MPLLTKQEMVKLLHISGIKFERLSRKLYLTYGFGYVKTGGVARWDYDGMVKVLNDHAEEIQSFKL